MGEEQPAPKSNMRTEAKQNECRDADSTASTYRHAHRTGAAPKGFLKFREGLAFGARPFQPCYGMSIFLTLRQNHDKLYRKSIVNN